MPEFSPSSDLRIAVLQVLLAAQKRNPEIGGASGKMLMDALQLDSLQNLELPLWYLREKEYIKVGERVFMITTRGVEYLNGAL